MIRVRVALLFVFFFFGSCASLFAQEVKQEPRIVLLPPSNITVIRSLQFGGGWLEVATVESDEKIAFRSVVIYVSGVSETRRVNFDDRGFSAASLHHPGKWDEKGNKIASGTIEEALLGAILGYYSLRRDDQEIPWNAGDVRDAIRKNSKSFTSDPSRVLGHFLVLADSHAAELTRLLRGGGMQRMMEFSVDGYLRLYQEFRTSVLPQARMPEPSLSVRPREKLSTTWAGLKSH